MRINTKEDTHNALLNCCECLMAKEDYLYSLMTDYCVGMDITFSFTPGEIPIITIKTNQVIQGGE